MVRFARATARSEGRCHLDGLARVRLRGPPSGAQSPGPNGPDQRAPVTPPPVGPGGAGGRAGS
eukprot:11242962-Heterocapsa_arctica.AAC.1